MRSGMLSRCAATSIHVGGDLLSLAGDLAINLGESRAFIILPRHSRQVTVSRRVSIAVRTKPTVMFTPPDQRLIGRWVDRRLGPS